MNPEQSFIIGAAGGEAVLPSGRMSNRHGMRISDSVFMRRIGPAKCAPAKTVHRRVGPEADANVATAWP